jgi:ubiquinone biosynthesis protein COQ9
MRQASPNPYQGLLFADYPTKNGTAVSALARRNVTSDQVKEQITDQVNKRLQAKIERQLVQMNPMARAVVSKTIEKTIKAAVNEAVDAIVFNDNDTSMAATSSS